MNTKIVTLWYLYSKRDFEFQFNHISDGYIEDQSYPISIDSKLTISWSKSKWQKIKGELDGNSVIPLEEVIGCNSFGYKNNE